MGEFFSQSKSASESGLGRTGSFVKFIILEQPKALLACGSDGGGVERGDIRCPGTINFIVVAVSNNVNWSGVMSVDNSACLSAASEYALCTAFSCEKTSPIFTQVDASGKLTPGNFFVKA